MLLGHLTQFFYIKLDSLLALPLDGRWEWVSTQLIEGTGYEARQTSKEQYKDTEIYAGRSTTVDRNQHVSIG